MRLITPLVILFLISPYLSGFCQSKTDVVNLMNGQVLNGTLRDTANGKVYFDLNLKGKIKKKEFEYYRVYSYQKVDQPECILYRKDTTIGNYLSQPEMKYYFMGERDALKKYNPWGIKITACLLTYGLSLADTYSKDTLSGKFIKGFFNSEPGLVSIVAPFAITALAGFPAVQIRIDKVSDKNLLNEQPYIDGFEKVARSKKVFGALKFSFIGGALGIASYFIGR